MGLITRPATERLVRGNRANALASTGPRTAKGKRRSSRNALKHGIYSHDLHQAMLDLGEDPRDYRRLLKGLTEGGRTWREIRLRERTFDREIEFKTRLLMDMQSAGAAPPSPAPLTERIAGNPHRSGKDRKGHRAQGKKPAQQGSGGRRAADCALRDRRAGTEAQAPGAWEPREALPPEDAGAEKVKISPNEAVRSLKTNDPGQTKSVKNAPNDASKGLVGAVTEADSGVFHHSGGDA